MTETNFNGENYTVSEFIATCNLCLYQDFSSAKVIGEVANFKVNQGKWVFFDLKDEQGSISCFLPLWELHAPLEDGMKILVEGHPKVTPWGKFSFTVKKIMPVGEGSIKKSFELLKRKLAKEGLFDPAKKRALPDGLTKIGVISSTTAAGYADFCKILNARWGGLEVQTCHTQVQGLAAPEQIIRALRYLNERAEVEVIAIIRGGGSADDLACFNDESLAREIAASRIPVITGIGHEVDESLADLAADIRASTPSNCAEMISPDRYAKISELNDTVNHLRFSLLQKLSNANASLNNQISSINSILRRSLSSLDSRATDAIAKIRRQINTEITSLEQDVSKTLKILESFNPDLILSRGYAILSGKLAVDNVVKITTLSQEIEAKVKSIKERS